MPASATADYLKQTTVLRTLLGDYLESVKEREFDLPFLLLLPELGFYDVHLTHGATELAKTSSPRGLMMVSSSNTHSDQGRQHQPS